MLPAARKSRELFAVFLLLGIELSIEMMWIFEKPDSNRSTQIVASLALLMRRFYAASAVFSLQGIALAFFCFI